MSTVHRTPEPPEMAAQPAVYPRVGATGPSTALAEPIVLEAEHLHKEFPVHGGMPFGSRRSVHAVEDVNIYLRPGRVTALVGESGSGKTTVARLLAGLYPPTSGTIRFRGDPVGGRGGVGPREYRRQVQLVFQDPFASLNPVHTVRYHLSRPLRIYRHARTAQEESALITSLLERVSLTPAELFIDKYPHELSGGQRQRVAIARALAARPSVLLADEPVSMLDVSIRLEVLNLLLRLKEEGGIAVLYITHDIASAYYFADDVLVMYAGQVVEGGSSGEVIQRPKHPYTRLLLESAPDPERARGQRPPVATRGDLPSLIRPPSGCRFRARCPLALPVCGERFPSPTQFADDHWANCFAYEGGQQSEVSYSSSTQP
jgi:peptide/nickel transport system ATP-binding protein